MSEWAVEAVARRRMRELAPGHYQMDRIQKNGPLLVDGVRHHPARGRSPLA